MKDKFELLVKQVNPNIDVMMICKTKIDSFPVFNFLIDSFCISYRLNQNSNGGGFYNLLVKLPLFFCNINFVFNELKPK